MINPIISITASAAGFIVSDNSANPPNIAISLSNKLFINGVSFVFTFDLYTKQYY